LAPSPSRRGCRLLLKEHRKHQQRVRIRPGQGGRFMGGTPQPAFRFPMPNSFEPHFEQPAFESRQRVGFLDLPPRRRFRPAFISDF
jgi:hypothetical protein